ncbi:hypothetical protein ACFQZS_08475 [Mucilaginibacter calamicampi]|uniref:Uncharacterized protein n=1 Tax=Mucilaginibacter calamicampi TaxID=1302352 RepID=A0ABW2YUT5_9SPHI
MTKEERVAKLVEIEASEPLMNKFIWYKGRRSEFGVHEIPLQLLSYNPYNGRIMSMTKSFEKQQGEIDLTDEKHRGLIEKFLWDSAPDYNQNTLKSLRKYGQNEIGIVTKDGVIIDGNRRAYLLGALNKEDGEKRTFLAIILPDELDQNSEEISTLETIYQIGVDDKVDYNPIEKYLKCAELTQFKSIEEVASLMSETDGKIKSYLSILALMKDYLIYIGYPEVFTKLYKKEGHFVDLNNYLNSYSKSATKYQLVNWPYSEADIDDLKKVYFDYIRLGLPVSNTRIIGRPNKMNSFFCHEELWSRFKAKHKASIAQYPEATLEEYIQINKGSDKDKASDERDTLWGEKVGHAILNNLNYYNRILEDKKNADSPGELLKRAKGTLSLIENRNIGLNNQQEVTEMVIEIKQQLALIESHITTLKA